MVIWWTERFKVRAFVWNISFVTIQISVLPCDQFNVSKIHNIWTVVYVQTYRLKLICLPSSWALRFFSPSGARAGNWHKLLSEELNQWLNWKDKKNSCKKQKRLRKYTWKRCHFYFICINITFFSCCQASISLIVKA